MISNCLFCAQLQDVGKMEDPKDDKEGTSQDPKYAILNFKSQTSPNESIYANVEPSQAPVTHNNFPTEPVEYAIIALKPLPPASKEWARPELPILPRV